MTKPRILLLCGGQSEEHDVSLSSARSVIAAAGAEFDVVPRVIDRAGRMLGADASRKALAADPHHGEGSQTLAELDPAAFDVVFPLLHGPHGEDGTVQGMLELTGVPYVGSGVLGSAVGMDKLAMKAVFAAHDLPQVAYEGITMHRWIHDGDGAVGQIERLGLPVFVKPANLGSSVGISRVDAASELRPAIEEAFRHDRRVIVERAVPQVRELEVAVLGNDAPEASPVGEIRYDAPFYDYETKYTAGRADLQIPADIPDGVADACRDLALRAFTAIDAAGLARVDFFYAEQTGEVFVNEINTMPGFTATSMYPKLWEAAGVPYGELVERLVGLALQRR